MALKTNTLAAATAVAAAFSLLATPAIAVDLPRPAAAKAFDGEALNAERDRRRRWHRDRDDIDAGDVVAGVVILGAIAAIAGAAKRNREERYPTEYPYPDADPDEDVRYRSPVENERFESRGLDRAVDMCVAEVERRSGRIGTVDGANRGTDGWRVSGELENGDSYSCAIGNDGRISDVRVGGYGYGTAPAERVDDYQYDEDYGGRETQSAPPPLPESDGVDGELYEISLAPR